MTSAGLQVTTSHDVNAIGLPTWILGMRLLRTAPRSGPILTAWDRYVMPPM